MTGSGCAENAGDTDQETLKYEKHHDSDETNTSAWLGQQCALGYSANPGEADTETMFVTLRKIPPPWMRKHHRWPFKTGDAGS